jgi:hypothetical protein
MTEKDLREATERNVEAWERMYDFNRNCEEVAKINCCRVVYPEPNQLQLDIDSEKSYDDFEKRMRSVHRWIEWDMAFDIRPSKSGLPHRHITVTVKNRVFTDSERIAFQLMFGSDPVRESVNAMRCAVGVENPCCLFVPLKEGE